MDKKKIDKRAVGERIRRIRINKGFTLEAFGKLFQAKKANVLQWEKGISLPNKERIKDISKIADITVNELLYGSEKDVEEIIQRFFMLSKDKQQECLERLSTEIDKMIR